MWFKVLGQNIHLIGSLLTYEYEEHQENTRPGRLDDTAQELQVKKLGGNRQKPVSKTENGHGFRFSKIRRFPTSKIGFRQNE